MTSVAYHNKGLCNCGSPIASESNQVRPVGSAQHFEHQAHTDHKVKMNSSLFVPQMFAGWCDDMSETRPENRGLCGSLIASESNRVKPIGSAQHFELQAHTDHKVKMNSSLFVPQITQLNSPSPRPPECLWQTHSGGPTPEGTLGRPPTAHSVSKEYWTLPKCPRPGEDLSKA